MPTNLAIDDKLIEAARRIGHTRRKEAVITALSEYIAHRKRLEILDLFGTVDCDPTYDYKAERRKRARKEVPRRSETVRDLRYVGR